MADVSTSFSAKDEGVDRMITHLEKRFKGFEGSVNSFSSKVSSLASSFRDLLGPLAAAAAAFVGARSAISAFNDAINMAGKLNNLAARTGEAAGELAVLQRAFQNAGSSPEEVGTILNRLQKFMVEGAEGGKTQAAAMQKLGLSFDELRGKSPSEQMQILAERISEINDPAQRTAVAMEVFGRSGGELIPLFRSMSAEIANARDQLGSYPDAVNKSAAALDDIGNNFAAIGTKAQEFITGALINIAPEIARITGEVSKIDFAQMGINLANAMQTAFDFFRGLWANPSVIFGLYGDYLETIFRGAGDTLIDGFSYAIKYLVTAWQSMIENDVFGKFAQVLTDAFMYAVANLNMALLNMIEKVLSFWGQLWGSVTQSGVSGLAQKLFDVVQFFASDFMMALTNPIAFATGKLSSALVGSIKESADAYQFSWDAATGSVIEKMRAGLQGTIDSSGASLRQSGAEFGKALSESMSDAAQKTEPVRYNFLSSAEATGTMQGHFANMTEAGAQIRADSEAAALAQSAVPSYSESLLAAYEAAGLNADHIRQQIAESKADMQITGNLVTGPSGIATATERAAIKTSDASAKITQAFDGVRKTGQSFATSTTKAAESFASQTRNAGLALEANIKEAMTSLTDYMSGLATESSLRQVVSLLKNLDEKLPQPVLV